MHRVSTTNNNNNPFGVFFFGRPSPFRRHRNHSSRHRRQSDNEHDDDLNNNNSNNNDSNNLFVSADGIVTLPSKPKIPPASSKFVDALPTLVLEHDAAILGLPDQADNECMICFHSYKSGSTIVSIPYCGHTYHKECLKEWFKRQCTCPYCRFEVPTDVPDYEVGRIERMSLRQGGRGRSSSSSSSYRRTRNSLYPNSQQSPLLQINDDDDDHIDETSPYLPRRNSLVEILEEKQLLANAYADRKLVLERLSFLCEPCGIVPHRNATSEDDEVGAPTEQEPPRRLLAVPAA